MGSGTKVDMKIVLLGKEFGGKTSLSERYLHNRFGLDNMPYQATVGAAFGAKKVDVGERYVVIGIWDTAGSERYQAMSRIYYRGAKAAIVCYDLTDKTSYEKARFWVDELLKCGEEDCKIYLCGTKKDLVAGENKRLRQVEYHDVTDYADEIGAQVFETSSKTNENINELFMKIVKDFADNPDNLNLLDSGSVPLGYPTPGQPERRPKKTCNC